MTYVAFLLAVAVVDLVLDRDAVDPEGCQYGRDVEACCVSFVWLNASFRHDILMEATTQSRSSTMTEIQGICEQIPRSASTML